MDVSCWTYLKKEILGGRKEMFYLTMHLTHFIYSDMTSDILYRTTQIERERKPAAITTWATLFN